MQLNDRDSLPSGSDRRKNQRVIPKYETVVYNGEIFGSVVDISKGGLAFSYDTSCTRVRDKFFELNLLGGQNIIFISNLFCRTVDDVPIENKILQELSLRRRCVRFSALTPHQIEQVGIFVKQ